MQLWLVFFAAVVIELRSVSAIEHLAAMGAHHDEFNLVVRFDAGAHLPDVGQPLLFVLHAHAMQTLQLYREGVRSRQRSLAISEVQVCGDDAQSLLLGKEVWPHDGNGNRTHTVRFPSSAYYFVTPTTVSSQLHRS